MPEIPKEFRRVVEQDVDRILHRHLSSPTCLSQWLFRKVFSDSHLLSIKIVHLNIEKDFRKAYGNPLAYGETDVEVIGVISKGQTSTQVAILIEDKVDADQMPCQGKRYQARAECDREAGTWSEYRCLIVGPRSYLDSQYPSGDHDKDGWDAALSLEEIASVFLISDELQPA